MIVELMTKREKSEHVQYLKIPNNRHKYIVYNVSAAIATAETEPNKRFCLYKKNFTYKYL